ncbi:hypothetical protein ACIBKY_44095 [Nonomuraea sp. NPDC050394]|uniref:hypothetical protein n=1 Tax=Nonomuraea sp. NPDC050394 TaxID=3364363 RepID=UPI0037AFDBA7
MPEDLSPAEIRFYDAFEDARRQAGGPTADKISGLVRRLRRLPSAAGRPLPAAAEPPQVPAPTIRGWIKRERLPREEESLLLVMTVLYGLRAEHRRPQPDRPDSRAFPQDFWRKLWLEAKAGRHERLNEPACAEPPPDHQGASRAAGGDQTRAESSGAEEQTLSPAVPSPAGARPGRHLLLSICGVALAGGALLIFLAGPSGQPQRQCATVTAAPSAPVWEDLDQPKLKDKRFGEQVELYQGLNSLSTTPASHQAVLLREGGKNTYGWMLKAHLRPSACNPR